MYIRDIKAWKKNIAELEQQRDDLNKEIRETKEELKSVCHHPKQYIKVREYYSPGGYLDTSYTDYTPYCELCGTEGETRTENHGHYG